MNRQENKFQKNYPLLGILNLYTILFGDLNFTN